MAVPAAINIQQIWPTIQKMLELELPSQQYDSYIARAEVSSVDDQVLVLVAPTQLAARWIKIHAAPRITELLSRSCPCRLHIKVSNQLELFSDTEEIAAPAAAPANGNGAAEPSRKSGLSPYYSFDNLVSGTCNELAIAAGLKLSSLQRSARMVSPLYIHGSVGLGKTHIAHAIGNRYLQLNPQGRVRALSGEQFMREVQSCFMGNKIDEFRRKFRMLDLLVIDDIQMIGSESKQTHRQFLGLFNFMDDNNRLLVLTSDRPVKQLERQLPNRLLSRLSAGVDVDVGVPDLDTRVSILRSQAFSTLQVELPDDTAQLLASRLRNNCRELLGALRSLAMRAEHHHCSLTPRLAREILEEIDTTPVNLSVRDIVDFTARHYKVKLADLQSKSRASKLVSVRHVAMYLCRELTRVSLPEIGEYFNRHHTSVLHACGKITKDMHKSPELVGEVNLLRQELSGGGDLQGRY